MIDDVEIRELVRQMHQATSNHFKTKRAAKNTGNGDLFREALELKFEAESLRLKINSQLSKKNL